MTAPDPPPQKQFPPPEERVRQLRKKEPDALDDLDWDEATGVVDAAVADAKRTTQASLSAVDRELEAYIDDVVKLRKATRTASASSPPPPPAKRNGKG